MTRSHPGRDGHAMSEWAKSGGRATGSARTDRGYVRMVPNHRQRGANSAQSARMRRAPRATAGTAPRLVRSTRQHVRRSDDPGRWARRRDAVGCAAGAGAAARLMRCCGRHGRAAAARGGSGSLAICRGLGGHDAARRAAVAGCGGGSVGGGRARGAARGCLRVGCAARLTNTLTERSIFASSPSSLESEKEPLRYRVASGGPPAAPLYRALEAPLKDG